MIDFYIGMALLIGIWLWVDCRPCLPGEWIGYVLISALWPLFIAFTIFICLTDREEA